LKTVFIAVNQVPESLLFGNCRSVHSGVHHLQC